MGESLHCLEFIEQFSRLQVYIYIASDNALLLLCRRRLAETLHQQCLSLVFWFNRPSRLHPCGSCVSSSEKLINFMHFHNSCTQNCDHHILLIMTGNAHKESCHKLLSLILVREKGLYIIKTDCSDKMVVVAFTIKEKKL